MQRGISLGATPKAQAVHDQAIRSTTSGRRRIMSRLPFDDFFHTATGNSPYGYQCRLACGPDAEPDKPYTLLDGTTCRSQLINVPTGLGKTAAVVLAWLWNRAHLQKSEWPRRLAYCLPMRTLVEQTRNEARRWIESLAEKNLIPGKLSRIIILMGGEELEGNARDWDVYPEDNAILIGTQDMLLSRALNRGYGMARARWPMHFGLLNNDCLWVLDETQLMGAGLWTSAQLDWLRHDRFKPAKNCTTWWMSATVGTAFLETKDRKDAKMPAPAKTAITDAEAVKLDILKAVRPVSNWQPPKTQERKERSAFIAALAAAVQVEHTRHTLSLVVSNTVATAQEIFAALTSANTAGAEITLLTSRFRPADRKANLDKLLAFESARKPAVKNGDAAPAHNGLICVSTQVVEAGVDISARRLWTELAPWPSILQRLGRLNRDGKLNTQAAAHIFEIPADKNAVSPYAPDDLKAARKITDALAKKSEADPTKPIRELLSELSSPSGCVHADIAKSLEPKPCTFPRAFEIHGLFSTEPDVFGGFTDVSPWVRGGDKNADVTVFWRDWDVAKKSPNTSEYTGPSFQRDEGCAVAIHRIRDFVKSSKTAFIWNDRVEKWESVRQDDICPGMVVMLPASGGGYDVSKGWTGEKADKPANTPPPGPFDAEGENDDKQTTAKLQWVALDAHLAAVAAETEKISNALALPPAQKIALLRAAALHDIGKSFPQWQDALPTPRPDATTLWAKAPSFAKRAGMRHEAASALAAWRRYYRDRAVDFPALTIYLIAAHHGFVRTVLNSRSAPAKQPNVAGIPVIEPPPSLPWHNKPGDNWQLDFAPASDGANGTFSENANGELVFIPTSPGWTALVADLLGGWEADAPPDTAGAVPANEPHSLNPFHLAFLETLLRAADCRISASETGISDTEAAKQ
jgi:CRISPR-associated endonuclease/helicase Cas3